jgi:uncharacterized membrane protein YGL010W
MHELVVGIDIKTRPRVRICASRGVGIPLIAASIPIGATLVGLPLAATMFMIGAGFQFAGHAFEGKPPSFMRDRRNTFVGLLWWMKKMGVPIEAREAA